MYNARLTGSSEVIMNQDAQCTGSGSIQSICRPPMAERNTRVIRQIPLKMAGRKAWRFYLLLLELGELNPFEAICQPLAGKRWFSCSELIQNLAKFWQYIGKTEDQGIMPFPFPFRNEMIDQVNSRPQFGEVFQSFQLIW